jgi:uncharacterized membrane protein YbhN (UPF0104 family)
MDHAAPESPAPASTHSRKRKLILRLVIAAVVLAALAIAGRRFYGELDRLAKVDPRVIAAMAALYVMGRIPPTWIMRAGLRALGHHIGRAETFFVLMSQYYVNMLIPRAGLGAVAGYLKIKRGVPVADMSAAQLVLMTIAQFACIGLIAFAVLAYLAATRQAQFDPILGALFGAVGAACLLPLLIPIPASLVGRGDSVSHVIGKFLARLSDGCHRLGRDRGLVARAMLIHTIVLLIRAARVQLSFYGVGQPVKFWPAFVASCLADVAFLVSITPGALGFREGGVVYVAPMLGTTGDVALAAAVLDRLVLTGCNIVFGQIGLWRYVGGRSPAVAAVVVGADAAPDPRGISK